MSPKAQPETEEKKKDLAGFFSSVSVQKAAFAALFSAVVIGWMAKGWVYNALAGKADAATTKTLEQKVDTIETEQKVMKGEIKNLSEDVEGARRDLRAIFPGLNTMRPLPTEHPLPSPTP